MKKKHQINTKKIAATALSLSLAMMIGVIENLVPPVFPPLPFLKIGLSNLVLLVCIIYISYSSAFIVSILKSIIVPLIVGNPFMIAYSLPSSLLSCITMTLLLNYRLVGIPIASIISAITHNLIQLFVASIVINSKLIFSLFPYLFFISVFSGSLIGTICTFIVKKYKFNLFQKEINSQ